MDGPAARIMFMVVFGLAPRVALSAPTVIRYPARAMSDLYRVIPYPDSAYHVDDRRSWAYVISQDVRIAT
jgi:hypothetical protein